MTIGNLVDIRLLEEELILLARLRETQPRVASLRIEFMGDRIKSDPATIEELRDILTEVLATVGFDEHYNPTVEGTAIENIIDKLFSPNDK